MLYYCAMPVGRWNPTCLSDTAKRFFGMVRFSMARPKHNQEETESASVTAIEFGWRPCKRNDLQIGLTSPKGEPLKLRDANPEPGYLYVSQLNSAVKTALLFYGTCDWGHITGAFIEASRTLRHSNQQDQKGICIIANDGSCSARYYHQWEVIIISLMNAPTQ